MAGGLLAVITNIVQKIFFSGGNRGEGYVLRDVQ